MPHTSKKQHLISSLESLVPVWDFALSLLEAVSREDFPQDEVDELFAIVSDAAELVDTEAKKSEAVAMQKKIREMYERERQHRETDFHHATEHLHHIL